MKKIHHRKLCFEILALVFTPAFVCCSGCGVVSVLGTPTSHEKKIPAEYNLAAVENSRILVLVHQPTWLRSDVNLRYYLTEAINSELKKRIKIPSGRLVAYDELSRFRSSRSDFSKLKPAQVGKALSADLVLDVTVTAFSLAEIIDTENYKGAMNIAGFITDAASSERLWPKAQESRIVKLGFEVGPRGQIPSVEKLADAGAHCIVRHLYDCPKKRFDHPDDKSDPGWQLWR